MWKRVERAGKVLAVIGLACCATTGITPPQLVPVERNPQAIAASVDRTWNAAIDAFAANNIAIQTLDKASGLLVPRDVVYVSEQSEEALRYADCGTYPRAAGGGFVVAKITPSGARFNVVVRGDSSRATVLVRAFFSAASPPTSCVSRGAFEERMEAAIRARAEAR